MTEEMLQRGIDYLENVTDEQLYADLVKAGFPADAFTVRQYPELPEGYDPQVKPEPYRHPFLTLGSHDE